MFVNIITGTILLFMFALIFAQAILLREKKQSDMRSRRAAKEWSEQNSKGKE